MAQVTATAATPFELEHTALTVSKTAYGPATRACKVVAGSITWSTASTSLIVDLTKETGTTAPAGGTTILTSTTDTSTTANTSTPIVLSATAADYTLAVGDRISFKISGTAGSVAGLCANLSLQYT